MRTCISIGNYATTPYVIPGLDVPVYCIEELCYLLGENAVLLDQTIMTRNLAKWVENELGLRALAEELMNQVMRQGSLSTFVCMILEFTGLQDTYYIEEVRRTLKRGAGLSSIERHKTQVDYLTQKKRFRTAVRGYHALIEKWDTVSRDKSSILPGLNVLCSIYHNLGVAYCGLMLYKQAADAFDQAYKLDGDKAHFHAYLAAMRMGMDREDYINFAANLADSYEDTLLLERKMERLDNEWRESGDAHRLVLRRQLKDSNEAQKYHDENDRLLRALKDSYRDNVEV